jgi:hypothetical protein
MATVLHHPEEVDERKVRRSPVFQQAPGVTKELKVRKSVVHDAIPFTRDDVVPTLFENERQNTGLRLQR